MILTKNSLKNEIWKGRNRYLPKDAHQKSDGGSVRSDFKKLDSFTLEKSKNHLIHSFLRNGRLRVNRYRTVCRLRAMRIFALEFILENEELSRKRRGAECPRGDTQSCGELFFQSCIG